MKVIKGDKIANEGSDSKTEEAKSFSRRKLRHESEKEIVYEKYRQKREIFDRKEKPYFEERWEKEKMLNGKTEGGKRRGSSYSREPTPMRRGDRDRKDYGKPYVRDGFRRNINDDLPKSRRENDFNNGERYSRHGRYEETRGYYRHDLNGSGRHEERRKSSFEDALEERNRRTVYIGNIPLSVKSAKHLLEVLRVDDSLIEEARIQPPKRYRYEAESMMSDRKSSQKAYITLKDERDVNILLEKNGVTCDGHVLKVDMVIHSKHYDREKTVIVKSLHFRVTEPELCEMFANCGRVKGYRLIRDRRTRRSMGYGFIFFEDKESVEEAIKIMNGKLVHDRPIIVDSMENDSGRVRGNWNHSGGGKRHYDYRVRKDISKRDSSYRRK